MPNPRDTILTVLPERIPAEGLLILGGEPRSGNGWEVVGDPGIEPGMGLPGGVTVRCRTLQHVARGPALGPARRRIYAGGSGSSRRNSPLTGLVREGDTREEGRARAGAVL